MNLRNRIEDFVRANQLLSQGDRILVAVSGGPDSVALLSLLASMGESWGLTLRVVHFNHGLRGMESQEDAEFVVELSRAFHVPCVVKTLDIQQHSLTATRTSLQEYARNIRYDALSSLAEQYGLNKISTGHTADDQAETMIMWMIRGAGSSGLSGIPPIRGLSIVRPLLHTSRDDVLSYLKQQNLTYRTDSSNQMPKYLRNRIRHEVFPILKQYNPHVVRAFSRQAEIVREEDRYLQGLAHEALGRIKKTNPQGGLSLDRKEVLTLPLALRRRVMRLVLQEMSGHDRSPRFAEIDRVLNQVVTGKSGARVFVHGVSVIREYEEIHVYEKSSEPRITEQGSQPGQTVPIPSHVVWPLTGQVVNVSERIVVGKGPWDESSSHRAIVDADTISRPLVLRAWMPGDHFFPLGMGGKRKKLQDFFCDMKLGRSKRHTVPLLVAPEGIVWVGGYRVDHRFRVTATSRNVLVVNLSQEPVSV